MEARKNAASLNYLLDFGITTGSLVLTLSTETGLLPSSQVYVRSFNATHLWVSLL